MTGGWQGWGMKEEGVAEPSVKQVTISFDFFLPLGNGGQLTHHYWSARFLCSLLCLLSPQPPRNRHMKIK